MGLPSTQKPLRATTILEFIDFPYTASGEEAISVLGIVELFHKEAKEVW